MFFRDSVSKANVEEQSKRFQPSMKGLWGERKMSVVAKRNLEAVFGSVVEQLPLEM